MQEFVLKNWWWPFFGWVLNTSKVNALQLFCNVHSKKIGLLEFARNIVINVPLFMGNKTLQEHWQSMVWLVMLLDGAI